MTAVLGGGRVAHDVGCLRFRFSDTNPITGRAYWWSRFDDLPYCVSLVVEDELGLSEHAWNNLVRQEAAEKFVGTGYYSLPLTVDRPLRAPRSGDGPAGLCPDCWGTCEQIDTDGSMTGTVGATFVCSCASLSRSSR
ncbi:MULTISPECIES: hypothetical protein [unclassified Saccharothrix]|uniref:hypothetical protein n=1 Tax=unclassified Saccharothrix TaxID=2593673 RepID=UPI00307E2DA0